MKVEQHLVLLVDDEQNILNSLYRLLRKEGYEIATATSGHQALELLEKYGREASIVVSDFKMPEMNGVEFLSRIKMCFPETVRIILSGFADSEMVQMAINEGQVYKLVSKPWDDNELKEIIRSSIEHYEKSRNTRSLMGRIDALKKEADLVGIDFSRSSSQGRVDDPGRLLSLDVSVPAMAFLPAWHEIINAIPAAIIGIDMEELVVLTNPAVERILRLKPGAIFGNSLTEAIPPVIAEIARPVLSGETAVVSRRIFIDEDLVKVECVALSGSQNREIKGALICAFVIDKST